MTANSASILAGTNDTGAIICAVVFRNLCFALIPSSSRSAPAMGWQSHLARARWMTVHGYRRLLLRSLPMLDAPEFCSEPLPCA